MIRVRIQSRIPFALIMLAFIVLRGIHLSHFYWIDERFSAVLATQPISRIPALSARDVHPPLYFLLLRGWNKIGLLFSAAPSPEKNVTALDYHLEKFTHDGAFTIERPARGQTVTMSGIWGADWGNYNLAPLWFLRSLSLLAGLASLVLLYEIGLLLFPDARTAAMLGALFLTVSAFSIFWDTTMRNYSLSTTLTLAVVLSLLVWREKWTVLGCAILAIALLLSFLTSYVSFFLIPAHVVLVFVMSRSRKTAPAFFLALLVSVVLFALLWGWAMAQQASLSYSHGIDFHHLVSRLARNLYRGFGFYWDFMFSYKPWESLDARNGVLFYPLFVIFCALMAAGIWMTVRSGQRSDIVLLVYVFSPVLLPVIVNTVSPDTLPFQPRHFYPVLSFLALLLARGLAWLIKVKS